jgi:hypothetical protein
MAAAASRQSARRFRRGCIECGHHRSDTDIRRARQTTVVDHPSFPRLPRRKTLQSTGTRSRSEPLESGRTSCRVARRAPSLALRDDGCTRANTATPPMGFGASRRNQPRGSLARRLASPAPSAPRVSHPLSGFIPSRPRGFVSRHFRPQAFGPPEPFPPSQPLRLSAPCALLPSRSRPRATPKCGTSTRRCGFRAFIRLSIRHPSDRSPTGRCSPGLPPLRGLPDTTAGPKSSPHALHLAKVGCARPAFAGLRPRV